MHYESFCGENVWPRSGSRKFLKVLIQNSLVVTTGQRNRTCRVDTKHSNNRLSIGSSTMGVCDSDALDISQVCEKKSQYFKIMPFWVCSKMLCGPERCKNSIWDYGEHLRLPAWMWFTKRKSSEIKWNQMSALLYLCWTDRMESRSRDKSAWMRRSPVVNKKKCCERKKK